MSTIPVNMDVSVTGTVSRPPAPPTIPLGVPILLDYLGKNNVFVTGDFVPWSTSQQYNFLTAAFDGNRIKVTTENPEFPEGELRRRIWTNADGEVIKGYLNMFPGDGQSNGVGATANLDGDFSPQPLPPVMVFPPVPNIFVCYNGGIETNQAGVTASSVTTPVDPSQYVFLRPACELINPMVQRQTWVSAFGEGLSLATDPSNLNLCFDNGHGSCTFQQLVGQIGDVLNSSWSASSGGLATFNTVNFHPVPVGGTFEIFGNNRSGYNRMYIALAGTDGGSKILIGQLVANPGGTGTGGSFDFYAIPWLDIVNQVTYGATVLAPLLGLKPRVPAVLYNGNEANSGIAASSSFWPTFGSVLRRRANKLRDICDPTQPDPWLVWPLVGWPDQDWHTGLTDPTRWNSGSFFTQGIFEASQDPTKRVLTFPMYDNIAGGVPPNSGDDAGGAIHYGNPGHINNGYKGYNVFVDAEAGIDTSVPCMISAVRVANSNVVTITLDRVMETVTDQYIRQPGADGYQFAAQATTGGVWGLLVDVVGKSSTGSQVTLTLGSTPAADSNVATYAWANETVYVLPNANSISNIVFTGTGTATITTSASNIIPAATDVIVVSSSVAGYNGRYTTTADISGTSISVTTALPDPGTAYTGGANIALNGQYGIARHDGLRGMEADPEPDVDLRWCCNQTAQWLRKFQAIQNMACDVYASTGRLSVALTQCGIVATPMIMDPSDTACISSPADAVILNPGTSGVLDKFYRGISPGTGSTPALIGTPGSFQSSTYLLFNGTGNSWLQVFDPALVDIWKNSHKAGGILTWFWFGKSGVGSANAQYNAVTGQMEGSGAAQGSGIRLASNAKNGVLIKNAANATVFGSSMVLPIPPNTDYIYCGSIQDGNNQSWMYDSINGPTFFNCVYASPSALDSQYPLTIGTNGTGQNRLLSNNTQLGGFVPMNTFLTYAKALAFIRTGFRKQIDKLPTG